MIVSHVGCLFHSCLFVFHSSSTTKSLLALENMSAELLEDVETFDVEYFHAFCEDWQERYRSIGESGFL